MKWNRTPPEQAGLYWYKHRDTNKIKDESNTAEPVRVTTDRRVLFLGDWRGHSLADLTEALWGDRIDPPA